MDGELVSIWTFILTLHVCRLPCWLSGKESSAMQKMQKTWVRSLSAEDPLEYEMATHSSILAWRIPMDSGV